MKKIIQVLKFKHVTLVGFFIQFMQFDSFVIDLYTVCINCFYTVLHLLLNGCCASDFELFRM